MKFKKTIDAPLGIRYISEWKNFWDLFPHDEPFMLNKRLTGCGFTQFAITTNLFNTVLLAPRRTMLESKHEKHPNTLLFIPNDEEGKYLAKRKEKLEMELGRFCFPEQDDPFPVCGEKFKILTTYDSAHHVIEILANLGLLQDTTFVVDECQSLITDSTFKAGVECGLLNTLNGISNLCYVSATPIEEDYLDLVDDFKDMPYFSIKWDDRIEQKRPLHIRKYKSLPAYLSGIIKAYRSGHSGYSKVVDGKVVESNECVFFINSVSDIVNIIKNNKIKPDEANVICAKNEDNIKRLSCLGHGIGRVPLEGEKHKMFTFCTATVYMGVDFNSLRAMTFVCSDSSKVSMATDISVELPQISGRQRIDQNPFKNDIVLLMKEGGFEETDIEAFDENIQTKVEMTDMELERFSELNEKQRKFYLKRYSKEAMIMKYEFNYVGVIFDTQSKTNKVIFNKTAMAAEVRAVKLQKENYRSTQTVLDSASSAGFDVAQALDFERRWNVTKDFTKRMEMYCDGMRKGLSVGSFCFIEPKFHQYYIDLGEEKLRAAGFREIDIERISHEASINEGLLTAFEIGSWYSNKEVKSKLRNTYKRAGHKGKPKAIEIMKYFEVKEAIRNKQHGYIIMNIK
ncbi:MAG: hypothetical protein LIP03_13405 [Bacteroidales bacterium]|nr:hypothetical protein [Bacteroidales bacterium]